MKASMRLYAWVVLLSLIGISAWATHHVSIAPAIMDLLTQPSRDYNAWFIATLFDAYFGFLWFWLWIAYRENRWTSRLVWLVLVLLTGNMAMAAYVLLALARLPDNARMEDLLLRKT